MSTHFHPDLTRASTCASNHLDMACRRRLPRRSLRSFAPQRHFKGPTERSRLARPHSRGWGLLEALLCSLLLCSGLVMLLRGQSALREHSDESRERAAAAVLAEAEVERLRAQTLAPTEALEASAFPEGIRARAVTRAAPGMAPGKSMFGGSGPLPDFPALTKAAVPAGPPAVPAASLPGDRLGDGPPDESIVELDSTRYFLKHRLDRIGPGPTQELDLTLRWQDRIGDWQSLRWSARVGLVQPGLAMVALRQPPPGDIAQYGGRHAAVPDTARDLGEGHAVLQPDPAAGTVWILDVQQARIVGLCELGDRSIDDLRAADLVACSARMPVGGALLLSGVIQFDLTDTPSPATPHSSALPLRVVLTLRRTDTSAAPPQCASNATAAVERGLAFVSYHCLVFPRSDDQRWSGRSELAGLAGDLRRHRVCRYSADHDHDGRVRNIEHPLDYEDVDGPLTQQNFLVIRAGLPCPEAPPDPSAGRLLDLGTVSHQPPA